MRRSKQLSAQPIHRAAPDARVDQPRSCPEPGKHRQPNDQHLKRGETDVKKIANSPHNSRFKISSLQLLVDPRRSPQKNANLGVFPLFPGAAQGASEIFQVLGNPSPQGLLY